MSALFGVAESPLEITEWSAATGITPDLSMIFEAWSRQRPLTDTFTKAKQLGHKAIMITWESWKPTPPGLPNEVQGAPQPEWSNASIAAGEHDWYIDQFARDAKAFGGTVYLRWGHEASGRWYPWWNDPVGYVAAWTHLRRRIRTERGAWNVKFVWSVNPDLWRTSPADWLSRLLPYWPGPAAVDYVGWTMINFGGTKRYEVAQFAERFDLAQRVFGRPQIACEMNVARELAADWLRDFTAWVDSGACPLQVVVLSQGQSRAAANGSTGDLSWRVQDEPALLAQVALLVQELRTT